MHASQALMHIWQISLSVCGRHASTHAWHIAMHASSMRIIAAGVMPCMRIMERIVV